MLPFETSIETIVKVWKNSKLQWKPFGLVAISHFNFSFFQTSTCVSITPWKHGECFLFLDLQCKTDLASEHKSEDNSGSNCTTASRIIILYYDRIISYYIILYHIISYYIILYHIISYHIISYHIRYYLRNRKRFQSFHTVIEIRMEVWENEKLKWEHDDDGRLFPR